MVYLVGTVINHNQLDTLQKLRGEPLAKGSQKTRFGFITKIDWIKGVHLDHADLYYASIGERSIIGYRATPFEEDYTSVEVINDYCQGLTSDMYRTLGKIFGKEDLEYDSDEEDEYGVAIYRVD